MALPLPSGLTPPEVAFLCEMETVTVVPRQRLEGLELLGIACDPLLHCMYLHNRLGIDVLQGPIAPLHPPQRSILPLWLALLLKRQRRANIIPPPWLSPASLDAILRLEITVSSFSAPPPMPPNTTSPPFLSSATADAPPDALPYHWLELGEMLLDAATDDIPEADSIRRLMRDLREVRMAKLRAGVTVLEGGREVKMNGVGGMEVSEGRAFIGGVVDELRKIGASKELSRKEREADEKENGIGTAGNEDNEDDMDYLR